MKLIKTISLCSMMLLGVTSLFAKEKPVRVGDQMPNIAAYKLEKIIAQGKESYAGKVMLVDFWASWCSPCKKSFPTMNQLQNQYGKQGFVIVGINVDKKKQDMGRFLQKNACNFDIMYDTNRIFIKRMQVSTMPTSFLVDRRGIIRYIHKGFHGRKSQKDITVQIQKLLSEPRSR